MVLRIKLIGFALFFAGMGNNTFSQNMVEKVLFEESFDVKNELAWSIGETDTRRTSIKNSNYIIEHISDDIAALSAREIPVYIPQNYYCEAPFKINSKLGAGFGILFGYSDPSNFHTFNISSNGYFRYGYYENAEYFEPVRWTETNLIKEGFNKLKVEFNEGKVIFSINENVVREISDYKGSFGSKMGFIVYGKQEMEVDYLKVAHLVEEEKIEQEPEEETITRVTETEDNYYEDYANKYALVVGNSKYDDMPLANPVNDANAISRELENIGFDVIKVTDASREEFRAAIRTFSDKLANNPGVGLFYYAGHGLQQNGINYLVPVEAKIIKEYEIEDECIRADLVLRMLASLENPMNVIILDACRNNPFARSMRSADRGLAQPQNAPTGSIIAFATAPGKTASDGDGENGLYTQELIKAMKKPGLSIERVFKEVRINVSELSNGEQIPWENSSLMGDFYFRRE